MHRFVSCLLAALAGTLALASVAAHAMPIAIPAGLNPGDTYRLAFVTSTTRDATSTNIADYNAFVTAAANASPLLAALGTTWTAIASTPTVAARDNTGTNPSSDGPGTAIYNLNSELVAAGNADWWDGSLSAAIQFTEFGGLYSGPVWTGTRPSGAPDSFSLESLGDITPLIGFAAQTNELWTASGFTRPQDFELSFYALSAEMIVPLTSDPVPEPATLAFLALGLAGLRLAGRRRRR